MDKGKGSYLTQDFWGGATSVYLARTWMTRSAFEHDGE
jgi:hypothetical protein